jgi:zinc protease
VQGGFAVLPDAFGGTYSTTPGDLELQLQLAAAFLTHPGYRPEAERRWREGIVLSWPRLDANPQNAFASRGSRLLASGDKRFGSDPDDGAIYRSFTELKAYLEPLLKAGAIEIAIVGDIDERLAIAAVARTFGALPTRGPEAARQQSARPVKFRNQREPIILPHGGESNQALVGLYWHVDIDPDADPQAVRVLNVLASVMRLKIIAKVREELGAGYSPSASSSVSGTYPGLAYVVAQSEVKPEDIDRAAAAMRAIAADLRAGEISDDEFNRAIAPSLEQLPLHASSNGYWLALISQAQGRPDRMERSKLSAVEDSLKAITREDLTAAANRWLGEVAVQEVRVVPAHSIAVEQVD